MRSYLPPEEWIQGQWIAGFTSKKGKEASALFCLMRVGEAFTTYKDLWDNSSILTSEAKEKKSASDHPRGDLYKPRPVIFDPSDPESYEKPHLKHVHATPNNPTYWHKDIAYQGKRNHRKAAYLIGKPSLSFQWDQKSLFWSSSETLKEIHRPCSKLSIEELLKGLEPT